MDPERRAKVITATTIERGVLAVLTLGLLVAGPREQAGAQDAPPTLEGSWRAEWRSGGDRGWVQLRDPDESQGHGSMSLREADSRALLEGASGTGEVGLTLTRPAGRLELEGRVGERGGRGEWSLRADPAFGEAMARVGAPLSEPREFLAAVVHDVRPERVEQLVAAGLERPDFGEVLAATIFQVDTTWIRQLRELGLDGDLDDFIAYRIHDVTPEFVRQVQSWGLEGLDGDDYVAFRIHGVDAEFVGEVEAWGLGPLNRDDLVAFRIHGVTRAFADQVRGWGLGEADGDELVGLRIHDVSGEFVASMREIGVPPEDLDQAVAFRIHGVTPELVRELREAGFEELDGDDLIKVRIHGFDRMLRRRGGG